METIKQSYLINSSPEKVWQALTNPKIIEKWGAGPAEMDDKVGTNFKLWGGDIFGKNTKIIVNQLLEQNWYGGDWDKPSKVTIKLTGKGDETQLDLVQVNIPKEEAEGIAEGWKKFYFGPLKITVENK